MMDQMLEPDKQTTRPSTEIAGWRMHLARLGWLVITSLVIILLVFIFRERPRTIWLNPNISDSYQILHPFISYRQYGIFILYFRYLVALVFISIAILVFLKKSKDWLGMLTATALVVLPYFAFYSGDLYEVNYPFPSPWRELIPIAEGLVTTTGILSLVVLLFTFPDGRFEPRKLKKPTLALLVTFIGIFFLTSPQFKLFSGAFLAFLENYLWMVLIFFVIVLILIGAAGQVYRYLRLSTPAQKQQTKWIVFSILLNLGLGALSILGLGGSLRFGAANIFGLVMVLVSPVIVLLLPLSLAFSVLRYRLWDIDVIIRRTLVYSALTGALSLLYFGGIAVSQALLTADRGENPVIGELGASANSQPSAAVIVLTTLAVYVLFTPLRRRIQDFIDRRFYRQKYDSEKALADFATSARSSTDLRELSSTLVNVVCDTLQPDSIILWLKPGINHTKQENI